MLRFNGTDLTEETVLKTRQMSAENYQGCIDEVKSGEVRVEDPEAYFAWRRKHIEEVLAGLYDHSVAFRQKAYWIQTGESIAILP